MADTKDFEALALPHLTPIYRAALGLCGNEAQAEDLAQTTFLKALERFETFRVGTNCKAWLMRILHNTWIDRLRHRKVAGPTVPVAEGLLARADGPEETAWTNADDLLENFSDQQVIRALSELPAEQRLTLYLADVEELAQEQVAEVMGVAVGTVKSRASRARTALRERLGEHARAIGLAGRRP